FSCALATGIQGIGVNFRVKSDLVIPVPSFFILNQGRLHAPDKHDLQFRVAIEVPLGSKKF
ncbi:MAG: hypothetical protein ABIR47_06945, partial [Candidatus Kapaibacterium sp.]